MKTIVCERFGSSVVLHVAKVATPAPCNSEVLIRSHAASASSTDTTFRSKAHFVAGHRATQRADR